MKRAFAFFIAASLPFFAVAQTSAAALAASSPLPAASSTIAKPIASKTGAQSAVKPVTAKPAKPADLAAFTKPLWVELTALQHQALKPLETSWNTISEPQKRKWLELSKNYRQLSPVEQATMHSRMVEWVGMSPQDRAAARLNFAKTKELSRQLTAEEKKAKWETYQALSPVEKAKLAANASPKPAGAATAVKPVELQKLAVTPQSVVILPKLPTTTPVTSASELAPGSAFVPAN